MKKRTKLVTLGRDPQANDGIVNPPVYHASTILFPTVAALRAAMKTPFEGTYYGRMGTPTSDAFESALAELEGGYRAVSLPSGLAAITTVLLATLKAGDHLLMVDTAYNPTRKFCEGPLEDLGIETTFYDPLIGARISKLFRKNTKVLYLESPGSLTFEVQDVPAMAAAARKRKIATIMDNTWATPLHFRPFAHGVDYVLHAATKYITGYSDTMLGAVVARDKRFFQPLKTMAVALGICAGVEELFLGLRGLRSLAPRLARHEDNALTLARWLAERPEVARVLHPALPGDPNHALWKRDFTGANGLLAIVLKPVPERAVAAMLDDLELFGMGFSWGGYESLILPLDPAASRSATRWTEKGPFIRIHAGLEDPDDLIADLKRGFGRLNRAARTRS